MINRILTVLLLVLTTTTSAYAIDYSGKTVTIWIPFKAGGGTDAWARAIGPAFSKNLPGNPKVIVQNVTEGGILGASNKYFSQHSNDKDGLVVFGTSGSVQLPYLFRDERVRYDYKNMIPVFGSGTGGVVYIRKDMGINNIIKDFKKLKSTSLVFGSQGVNSLDAIPALAFDMLGLDVNVVYGMKGRKVGRAAILRGETTIDYQTTASYLKHVKPLVDNGEMVPLMTWGSVINGQIKRDPNFPNLPSFSEVYDKVIKNKNKEAFDAWQVLFNAGFATQKFIVLPKSASDNVVTAWIKASGQIVNDFDTMKIINKKLGKYDQIIGENLIFALRKASTLDEPAYIYLSSWMDTKQ